VDAAVRELAGRVIDDVRAEGRPVIGLTLKVCQAPFETATRARKIPMTVDPSDVLSRVLELAAEIEPGRSIRLLGLRAVLPMPDSPSRGHAPNRSGR
jgi:DNA polymerase-4